MNIHRKKALVRAVQMAFPKPEQVDVSCALPEPEELIYPYYTIKEGAVKTVQVRFREGKNAREVMDFSLFLSPNDVWTCVVPTKGSIP